MMQQNESTSTRKLNFFVFYPMYIFFSNPARIKQTEEPQSNTERSSSSSSSTTSTSTQTNTESDTEKSTRRGKTETTTQGSNTEKTTQLSKILKTTTEGKKRLGGKIGGNLKMSPVRC